MDQYALGVDVGGTTVKMGCIKPDGTLLYTWEIPTRTENGGAMILKDISESIAEEMKKHDFQKERIIGIGMGVPGPVGNDGTVYKCANLGWGVFNVEEEMRALTGFPTKAANDANAAALGEMWMGGGKGYREMMLITLGTGIGGGIIMDGKIIPGFNGSAGEIGHITVNEEETEVCGCGKRGCLEQYASANGVARVAKKYLTEHDDDTVLRRIKVSRVTSKDVFDAARNGDEVALRLVDDFGKIMAQVLAQAACVINPQAFVIGGGMAKAGDILIDAIQKHFEKYAFHATRGTLFALASLGNAAGMYGGARMILDAQIPG